MTHLRIKELCEAADLNISDLSRSAELSYSTAHALWHSKPRQFDGATLDRIALILGVNVSDLFGGPPEYRAPERRKKKGT